jgi:hypothetical protein
MLLLRSHSLNWLLLNSDTLVASFLSQPTLLSSRVCRGNAFMLMTKKTVWAAHVTILHIFHCSLMTLIQGTRMYPSHIKNERFNKSPSGKRQRKHIHLWISMQGTHNFVLSTQIYTSLLISWSTVLLYVHSGWVFGGGGGDHFGWRPPWLGAAGRATFQLYPAICLTTEEKHGKPQSG